jgi:hypothetical protein
VRPMRWGLPGPQLWPSSAQYGSEAAGRPGAWEDLRWWRVPAERGAGGALRWQAVAGRGVRGDLRRTGSREAALKAVHCQRHKDCGLWAEEGDSGRSEEREVGGWLRGRTRLRQLAGEGLGKRGALQFLQQPLESWAPGKQLLLHLPWRE